jgi:hypothetical protein
MARRPPLVEVVTVTWLLAAGTALVALGSVAAIWVMALRCHETAAGGSAGPDRAAPAPGAPVEGAGAPGVTPDPIDRQLVEAAALLGQDDYLPDIDAVDAIRWRAVDYLANARLADDDATAIAWEDRCRDLLADELVPPELIELLITYMLRDADVRARRLLAGVEQVAGGGR